MGDFNVSGMARTVDEMTRYIILVLCVLSASFGQVLCKSTANTLKPLHSIWALALEPVFVAAVCLYGITALVWIWCLQEIPLSQAYLFMSLAYVFIPLMSWLYFGEVISIHYIIATTLIIAGILVAVLKA
jgi:drug/metabolite transporter (DMT)-like permease